MASEKILELDRNSFDSTIKNASEPVLVDFWAPWCGPCKAIAPILDELAEELSGKAIIGKVNVDNNSEIAQKFSIRAIPTLLIFKGGELVDQVVGMADKSQLKAKLEAQV